MEPLNSTTKLARIGPARWMRKPGPFHFVGLWARPASTRSGPARRATRPVQVSKHHHTTAASALERPQHRNL